MVQFSIAYVALGCSILLLLGGLFLMRSRYAGAALSSGQRAMIVGGVCGMVALLTLALVWWNGL